MRERMGIRVDAEEAQEEAEEIGRPEDEGDAGDQAHVSPARPHGLGYTVSDLGGTPHRYGTPPAYYDFMSGPIPTTTQVETTPTEPSGPSPPQRPTRATRPPLCGTGGHLHHDSGYM
ncbi:hypothetical protein PIB30_003524 [Stylosanthes scabra]|uniref:Uncharacterized protein n=1 Tax=Stylosanthes scabra TaxID=79078 RepID=A0ABU6W6N2_9FABA|nr:hypothetical protein [Stylosanthes scabra]